MCFLALLNFSVNAQDKNYEEGIYIVRFNPKYLDYDIIDDRSVRDIQVKDILNGDGYRILEGLDLSENFDFYSVSGNKIFMNLRTIDSVSISRLGEEVTIPPFWATMKLQIPSDLEMGEFDRILSDMYPLILYAHPNYLAKLTSIPDDEFF